MPHTQQHHHALPAVPTAVREVARATVAVTVGPLEVLDDDPGAIVGEHDVRDIFAEAFRTRGVDLLSHLVTGRWELTLEGQLTVDLLDEESLKRVTELVCAV